MRVPADVTTLDAVDVRRRLFAALDPVRKLAEAFVVSSGGDPRALRYVVQMHPLAVQVTLAPDEGRPAQRLVAFAGRRLPGHGAALEEAVNEFTAGTLAGMPKASAEAAVLNAAVAHEGGLCVMADPTDETALLFFAEGDMGKGVVLGAIADAPEQVH